MTQTALTILQLILSAGNLCIMLFAFYKFINRPHTRLEERVSVLEVRVNDIEKSLKQGNDRFREQDDAIEVITQNVLALVEFEIEYCLTEHKTPSAALEEAKKALNRYLSRR